MLPSPSHSRSVMLPVLPTPGSTPGICVVGDFTIEANADGEWDWSISAAPLPGSSPTRRPLREPMTAQVQVEGLADLARELKRIDPALNKQLRLVNKNVSRKVVERAGLLSPASLHRADRLLLAV